MSRDDELRRRLVTRTPRPAPPGDLRLSVILPAYREPRIGASVAAVRAALEPVLGAGDLEVVVVDDGSTDDTALRARNAEADQVIRLPENRGKGAAVRAGVAAARGRTIAFTDADLAYEPHQLLRLLAEVEDGWDLVVGSRRHPDTETVAAASPLRSLGGRAINAATRLVLRGGHADTQCGIKAFRSDVGRLAFDRCRIDGFAFDVELYVVAERNGLSLAEVPVAVENSTESTVRVVRDAVRLLGDLLRIRRAAAAGAYRIDPARLDDLRMAAE